MVRTVTVGPVFSIMKRLKVANATQTPLSTQKPIPVNVFTLFKGGDSGKDAFIVKLLFILIVQIKFVSVSLWLYTIKLLNHVSAKLIIFLIHITINVNALDL